MLKVGWMTPYGEADLWNPALRLRRKNVQENLESRGLANTVYLSGYYDMTDEAILLALRGCDVVVMTEQSERDFRISRMFKERTHAAVVRDHCEYVFGWPWQTECYSDADLVVCASTLIAEATEAHGFRSSCVPDMYEPITPVVPRNKSDGLRAVFMGSGASLQMVNSPWASFVAEAGYSLEIITDVEGVGKKWESSSWRQWYGECDVAIVPQDTLGYPGKSSVKVAQALGAGLPVICSPLRSYVEAVVHGQDGYIHSNSDIRGWHSSLVALKDPGLRSAVSARALESSKVFSPDAISDRWLTEFKKAMKLARTRDGI